MREQDQSIVMLLRVHNLRNTMTFTMLVIGAVDSKSHDCTLLGISGLHLFLRAFVEEVQRIGSI